jgi:predicted enzyme related to lactoylglutathione lyase
MAHPVVHFEIHGKDGEALSKFYSDLFGWKPTLADGIPYRTIDTGGGKNAITGGIMQSDNPTVTFYIEVDDVTKSLKEAEKLGASIVLEEHDVPGGPTIGMLSDPEGNVVGVVKHDSM